MHYLSHCSVVDPYATCSKLQETTGFEGVEMLFLSRENCNDNAALVRSAAMTTMLVLRATVVMGNIGRVSCDIVIEGSLDGLKDGMFQDDYR